jgi:hypothetical protein
MIKKINNLIKYIDDKNSIFHKRLVAIATKLSEPIEAIEIDLLELKSMVDPDLADKDIGIEEVKIEL